jgi:hypothetical protein
MKKYILAAIGLVALIATVGLVTASYGSAASERHYLGEDFIDGNDDGVCDNWVDEDGDGMNDLRPLDGSGNKHRYGVGLRRGSGHGPGVGSRNCTFDDE